ncbi:MAG: phosphonate C-P lyase system protein PhnG [Bosea sp. (in: a-proteobacteria)]
MNSVTSVSSALGTSEAMSDRTPPSSARKGALALLARATELELVGPVARNWPELAVRELKKPEIGLAMLRGRMGGDGAAFNLGEATVTRCVVELAGGQRGNGQMLGRNQKLARLAAIADALWQVEAERAVVEREILEPIRNRLVSEKAKAKAETAATRVDFFTLVRGDT